MQVFEVQKLHDLWKIVNLDDRVFFADELTIDSPSRSISVPLTWSLPTFRRFIKYIETKMRNPLLTLHNVPEYNKNIYLKKKNLRILTTRDIYPLILLKKRNKNKVKFRIEQNRKIINSSQSVYDVYLEQNTLYIMYIIQTYFIGCRTVIKRYPLYQLRSGLLAQLLGYLTPCSNAIDNFINCSVV